MGLFHYRYLCIGLSFFFASLAIAFIFGLKAFLFALFGFALIFALIFVFFRRKIRNLPVVIILSLILSVIGGIRAYSYNEGIDRIIRDYAGEAFIYGYIDEIDYSESYYSEYKIKVEKANNNKESFYAIICADFDLGLGRGDFISANVVLTNINEGQNREFYDADCIAVCTVSSPESISYEKAEFRIALMLASLRLRMSGFLVESIGGENGKLASAFILGERELISGEIIRDFRRTGLFHLLSLSGTHISIIIGIFELILKKLYVPKWLRCVICSFLALFYIALTGFLPPACRSMLMLWLLYMAYLFGRSQDPITTLFTSVSIIVLISPASVLDIGLILSFLATLGIIIAMIIVSKFKIMNLDKPKSRVWQVGYKLLKQIVLLLLSALLVFVLTLPVIYLFFGEVSLASFFTNIFMGIICEVFIFCCVMVLLFSPFSFAVQVFAFGARFFGSLMTDIISFISNFRGIVLSLRYDFAGLLVWALFAFTLLMLILRLKRLWLIFVPSLAFALVFFVCVTLFNAEKGEELSVEFFSLDAGDAFVVSNVNEAYIIDYSSGESLPSYFAFSLVEDGCYTEAEGFVITHYNKNLAITLKKLSQKKMIRKIYLPQPITSEDFLAFSSIFRTFENSSSNLVLYDYKEELCLSNIELFVSAPHYSSISEHPAQIITLSYGEDSLAYASCGALDSSISFNDTSLARLFEADTFIYGSHGFAGEEMPDLTVLLKNGCEVCFSGEYFCFIEGALKGVKYQKIIMN